MSSSFRPIRRRSLLGRLQLFRGRRKPSLEESQIISNKDNNSDSPTSIADFPSEIAFFATDEACDVESLVTSSIIPEDHTVEFQSSVLGLVGLATRHQQDETNDIFRPFTFNHSQSNLDSSTVFVSAVSVLKGDDKENQPMTIEGVERENQERNLYSPKSNTVVVLGATSSSQANEPNPFPDIDQKERSSSPSLSRLDLISFNSANSEESMPLLITHSESELGAFCSANLAESITNTDEQDPEADKKEQASDFCSSISNNRTNSNPVFTKGDHVTVHSTNHKHNGKQGIVTRAGPKMAWVTLDNSDVKTRGYHKDFRLSDSQATSIPNITTNANPEPKEGDSVVTVRPSISNDRTNSNPIFTKGDLVTVHSTNHKHNGKQGVVTRAGPKMAWVTLDNSDVKTRGYHKDFRLSDSQATSIPNITTNANPEFKDGDRVMTVNLNNPKCQAKYGTVMHPESLQRSETLALEGVLAPSPVKTRAQKAAGALSTIAKAISPRNTRKPTSRSKPDFDEASSRALDGFKWPGSDKGGLTFGSRRIRKIRTEKNKKSAKDTFLSHWLGERTVVEDQSLNEEEPTEGLETERSIDGRKYELVSAKVVADDEKNANPFGGFRIQQKCLRLVYAEVDGPNMEPVDLKEMLERLGDFGSLDPRKAASRLELLQSPALKLKPKEYAILAIKETDICMVDANGQDGCGFICEEFLEKLLGNNAPAKRTVAIQIRLICPAFGIFKGMLMRKRNVTGPPIQLNETMRKVGPSRLPVTGSFAKNGILVVTRIGKHPNSTNEQVARLLNSGKAVTKTFTDKIKLKKVSTMYTRIWKALDTPTEQIEKYVMKSLKPEGLEHACVVGVADPTCQLPSGSVFVTGTKHAKWSSKEKIYVTRSPCVEPKDGRMLPVITSRPAEMSEDDWEWLQNLRFGAIIFANPKSDEKPMPELVAGGDLDGDLYFICWSDQILSCIQADPITDEERRLVEPEGTREIKAARPYDENWLEKTQQIMLDAPSHFLLGNLIGKLYTGAQKIADESDNFMREPSCIAYATAFKRALEMGKHGGKVYLPEHLHDKIPPNLRCLLESDQEA
jgi:hypothetical protein